MIRTALRAWAFAVLALIAASAGMAALTASNSTTSLVRMAVAAAVLSGYTGAIAVLTTQRSARTRIRCLLWGGTVPLLVGIGTGLLVGASAGGAAGLWAALPWLTGVLVCGLFGPWLPSLRLPRVRRRAAVVRPPY